MIDPKKQAELDQASALMIELLPPMWRKMYVALLQEGFERAEAMEILKAYILSQSSYGINGTR